MSRNCLLAAVVKYGGKKFFAYLRIKANDKSRNSTTNPMPIFKAIVINAWPWPKNDPVKFDPNDAATDLALQDLKKPLDQLTEDDFRKLAPFQDEYTVRHFLSRS